jgi:hypothetical protein
MIHTASPDTPGLPWGRPGRLAGRRHDTADHHGIGSPYALALQLRPPTTCLHREVSLRSLDLVRSASLPEVCDHLTVPHTYCW